MDTAFCQLLTQIEQNVKNSVLSLQQTVVCMKETEDLFNNGVLVLHAEKQKLENDLQAKLQRVKKDQEQVKLQKREIENEKEKIERERRVLEEEKSRNIFELLSSGNITEEIKHELEHLELVRKEINIERERLETEKREYKKNRSTKRKSRTGRSQEEKQSKVPSTRRTNLGESEESSKKKSLDFDRDRTQTKAQKPESQSEKDRPFSKSDEESTDMSTKISAKRRSIEKVIQEMEGQRITVQIPLKQVTQKTRPRPQTSSQSSSREQISDKHKQKSTTDGRTSPSQSPRWNLLKSETEHTPPQSPTSHRKTSTSDTYTVRQRSKSRTPPVSVHKLKSPPSVESMTQSLSQQSSPSPRDVSPRRQTSTTESQKQQNQHFLLRATKPESSSDEAISPPTTTSRGKIDPSHIGDISGSGISEDPLVRNLPLILTKLVDVVSSFEETIRSLKGTSRGLDRDLCRRSLQDLVVVQKEVYNFFQGRFPEIDTFLARKCSWTDVCF